jgi:hypothetical protein
MIVTVFPETVHTAGVGDEKLTARPELAVAPTLNGAMPSVTLPSGAKPIVCASGFTVKVCVTGAAAAQLAFPA